MKNCKFDYKGHIVSYENDHGDTITDYKQLSKNLGIDQDNNQSTNTSYIAPEVYDEPKVAVGETSHDIVAIAVLLMVLASVAIIVILWIVAFRAKSNLFVMTTIITFAILGFDAFVIATTGGSLGSLLSHNKRERRRIESELEEEFGDEK
jgi:hypothetical protein